MPKDIPEFLTKHTASGGGYRATSFWAVVCPCGSDSFHLQRAGSITRRTCTGCAQVGYVSRFGDGSGWDEAVEDGGTESFTCYECDASKGANVCVGFAGYPNNPKLDAVLWYFVGTWCCGCGLFGCFNDGKVGRGPMAESVFREVAGERPYQRQAEPGAAPDPAT